MGLRHLVGLCLALFVIERRKQVRQPAHGRGVRVLLPLPPWVSADGGPAVSLQSNIGVTRPWPSVHTWPAPGERLTLVCGYALDGLCLRALGFLVAAKVTVIDAGLALLLAHPATCLTGAVARCLKRWRARGE
jgi:hypothetical protein